MTQNDSKKNQQIQTQPPQRPSINHVGDLVLTNPQAMLALAHPGRLTLLAQLRRNGPLTILEFSTRIHTAPSELLQHLEALEPYGLVARNSSEHEDQWRAVAKGFFFEIPEDLEGQRAARALSNAMILDVAELPRRWVDGDEARLSLDWAQASGLFNARVMVTPEELRGLQIELEHLFEPFTTRQANLVPDGAAAVRALCFFMPEPISKNP